MSDKPSLFAELKRRNVLKVAPVYAVTSWLLIELAWIFLPMIEETLARRNLGVRARDAVIVR